MFRSTYDGDQHLFTPESAVARPGAARRGHPDGARRVRGAAVGPSGPAPTPWSAPPQWAARAQAAHRRTEDQALFGIVQGGDLTSTCGSSRPERTVELDFDGYAIGGLSVGETRDVMLPALAAAIARAARRPAPVPDGRRRPRVDHRGGGARRRHVRLRAADPPGPPRARC